MIFEANGIAQFKGDVAIGDSSAFFGTIGDAVTLLPNSIVDQFKAVIDGLPKAEPYDETTLPADLPTPLKDALVRVTTAGKINLNSNGTATFAGEIRYEGSGDNYGLVVNKTGGNSKGIYIGTASTTDNSDLITAQSGYGGDGVVDRFTVKADGTAEFSGDVFAKKQFRTRNNYGTADSTVLGVVVEGSDGTVNAKIGYDGSAEFAGPIRTANGLVQAVSDVSDLGGTAGINRPPADYPNIFSNIGVYTGGINGNNSFNYIGGYNKPGTTVVTSQIDWAGNATFAGQVNSGSLSTGNGSRLNSSGGIEARNDGGGYNLFTAYRGSTSESDITARITSDGNATFAGTVRSDKGYTCYPVSDSDYAFATRNAANTFWSAYITGAGDGIFDGKVEAGKPTDNAVGGVRIANEGQLRVNYAGDDADSAAILLGLHKGQERATIFADGSATFTGDIDAGNISFNLEPENDANYTVTTEEYEEQEELTPYVPAVDAVYGEPPLITPAVDPVTGPLGNVLVEGTEAVYGEAPLISEAVPAVEATYHTVTKTREIKTYTGPTLDVKEELQSLRARATQQDEVIAMLTEAVEALKAAPASDFESRIAALEVDMARFKAI